MKTLKRTLCLVLVLVMVVGLLSVCANAAFTDEDEIEYNVAVGVMSGMGIIKGRDTGDFDPNGSVSRAEIATMIYKAATGDVDGKNIGVYANSNAFVDVPEGEWCAGYVNYAANKGYVVGDGDGNFRPYGQVTGYEAIVMVLRMLGYDSDAAGNEITSAADWKIEAIDRAVELRLVNNVLDKDLDKPITRDVTAEILYQAFLKDTVVYSKDKSSYVSADPAVAPFDKFDYTGSKTAATAVTKVEKVTEAKKSSYEGFEVGALVASAGSYKFVVNSYAAVGNEYIIYFDDDDGTVYYADKQTSAVTLTDDMISKMDKTKNTIGGYKYGATEALYTNYESDSTIDLEGVNAIAAGDVIIVNAKNEIVAVQQTEVDMIKVVVDTDSKGVKTAKTDLNGTSSTLPDLLYSSDTKEDVQKTVVASTGVDFAALKDGDYYYNNVAVDNVNNLTAIQTITGKITSINTSASAKTITVDGTPYKYVDAGTSYTGLTLTTSSDTLFTDTYTFYINVKGEIFANKVVEKGESVLGTPAYVVDAFEVKGSNDPIYGDAGASTYSVQVVYMDGTYTTLQLAKVGGLAPADSDVEDKTFAFGSFKSGLASAPLYYVNVNSEGKAELTAYTSGKFDTYEVESLGSLTANSFDVLSVNAGGKAIYIDENTTFIYMGASGSSFKTDIINGKHKTGIVSYSTATAKILYTTDKISTAKVVLVPVAYEAPEVKVESTDQYILTEFVAQSADGYAYTAYKVGTTEAVTLTLSEPSDSMLFETTHKAYTLETTTGSDGKVTYALTDTDSTEADFLKVTATGVYTVNGVTYVGSDVVINSSCVLVNLVDKGTVASIADLEKDDEFYYFDNDKGEIIAIFVTSEAADA